MAVSYVGNMLRMTAAADTFSMKLRVQTVVFGATTTGVVEYTMHVGTQNITARLRCLAGDTVSIPFPFGIIIDGVTITSISGTDAALMAILV